MTMRRHFLGDRGENEVDIQQSENELSGETEITNQLDEDKVDEEEQMNDDDDDEPPPLEDIDEPEVEKENEIIEQIINISAVDNPKEDDIGMICLFIEYSILFLSIRYSIYSTTTSEYCGSFIS
jgi:hypothetical protein